MNNDYLWDGSGEPDPDVERLEALLGGLRSVAPLPALPTPRVRLQPVRSVRHARPAGPGGADGPDRSDGPDGRWRRTRMLAPFLATAAAVTFMVGVAWKTTSRATPTPSWAVARLAGQPRIGPTTVTGSGRLALGETLVTDSKSRARIDVSAVGHVTVDGDTSVRLVATRDEHHRLALTRGTLHAFITAPPGQFVVDTPSATATDLGCVYTLHVNDDGSGLLSVIAGWVAFEFNGRESFVPADASARTDAAAGPGTPRYDDAAEEVKAALDRIDFSRGGQDAALRLVLDRARPRDAVTLWHLIARVGPSNRAAVVDALASRVPLPAAVTREAVMRLDRAALDQWWDALGLGDASWWRMWKGPYPQTSSARATARSPSPASAGAPEPSAAAAASRAAAGVAASDASSSCPETPRVSEEPPPDPGGDRFGSGPWNVNADRTIWVEPSAPWHEGSHKVMWIRPAGTQLTVQGTRLDADAAPLTAHIPCCYPTGFQVSTITFPAAGGWRVTAKAGDHELQFVTKVWPR